MLLDPAVSIPASSTGNDRFDYVQFPIDYNTNPSTHGIVSYDGYEYANLGGTFPGVVQQNIGYWYYKQDEQIITCSSSDLVVSSSGKCEFNPTEIREGPQTAKVDTRQHFKCCADVDPGPGYQGWGRLFNGSEQQVCPLTLSFESTNLRPSDNPIGCPEDAMKTHEEATAFCTGYGGRLCTQDELGNDCARGVGCGYDIELIWTTNYHYQYSANTGCLSSQNNPVVSQSAMQVCDASISFLAGSETSVGTATKLVKLIEEKGRERMPGTCCLDTPTSSDLFGEEVCSTISVMCVYMLVVETYIYLLPLLLLSV